MLSKRPSTHSRAKAQSAMEYLMTYGWAILIIAVVLGALFSLGVFSSSPIGSACVAASGYLCTGLVYSHTSGNIVVSLGQNSGSTYYNANVAFVPQGTASNTATGAACQLYAQAGAISYNTVGTLSPGQTTSVYLPVVTSTNTYCTVSLAYLGPQTVGAPLAGTIWLTYETSNTAGATALYVQVATITTKAQ